MDPAQILENERRTAKPAVIAAFVAAGFLVAGTFVGFGSAASTTGSGALLRDVADTNGIRLLAVTLQSLGFLAFIVPLHYLFMAAANRSARVNRSFRGMVIIGPVLLAIAGVAVSISLASAADEFVEQIPGIEVRDGEAAIDTVVETANTTPDDLSEARLYPAETDGGGSDDTAQAATGDGAQVNGSGTEPSPEPGSGTLEVEPTDGEVFLVPVAADRFDDLESQLDASDVRFTVDSEGQPGDLLADVIRRDKTLGAQLLLAAGGFSTLFAIFYTALQAMRAGLLTRFWGTLAMALSVILITPLVGSAIPGLALFSGYLGRLYGNSLNGPRPPAWDTGEAIPWIRPGDIPQDGSGGDQVGLPEGYGADAESEASDEGLRTMIGEAESPANADSPRKRKRKRR